MDDDDAALLPDEDFLPLILFSLLLALPSLGLSLLVLWAWKILPRAWAPKEDDFFLELRRHVELAGPLVVVFAGWAVFAWQWSEGHPLNDAIQQNPWPVVPMVLAILFVIGGAAAGLAIVLRTFLARQS
jgi:hypothetical protein